MKNRVRIIVALIAMVMTTTWAAAQAKVDTERMDRDLEIAENALATIIRQQFDRKGMWVEVKANYTPGFGVTMRLPNDNSSWIFEGMGKTPRAVIAPGGSTVIVVGSEAEREQKEKRRNESRDSARVVFYDKVIKASKDFIADYGDLISQLAPEEKILITNRGEGGGRWHYDYNDKSQKRRLVTIEGTKGDISQFRQSKLSRDQIMQKIKVVNTETVNEKETDLELFSSIMSRLYRSDLSKTFYSDDNIYYERLRDFGVIYYMQAYSSSEQNRRDERTEGKVWQMPTQRLEGLTQEQRDKKVIELYPQFEKDLKENIVEYAQTVKSLGANEMIVFNVQITKCIGCNIPASLELSLRNDNVRKLAAGDMSKSDVVNSIHVKKGVNQ